MASGRHDAAGTGPGEALRRAREARGIGLDELAARTKIRRRHLEALEDERFAELPSRAHAAAFLRTAAREVGLDPEEAADRLRRLAPAEPVAAPGPRSRPALAALAAALVAGAGIAAAVALGGGEDEAPPVSGTDHRAPEARAPARSGAPLTLRLEALVPVEACLLGDAERPLIDWQRLGAGASEGPFTARRFRLDLLSGGRVAVRLDGVRRVLRAPRATRFVIVADGLWQAPLRTQGCP